MVTTSYREQLPTELFNSQLDSTISAPHNIDAEESILGGLVLDPKAYDKVKNILASKHFYVSTHSVIYEACKDLGDSNYPIDMMTVTTWLNDRGLLEKIGGTAKLVSVVSRTVSAINIDRYAQLIVEKYREREFLHLCNQASQKGYDNSRNLDARISALMRDLKHIYGNSDRDRLSLDIQSYLEETNCLEQLNLRRKIQSTYHLSNIAFQKLVEKAEAEANRPPKVVENLEEFFEGEDEELEWIVPRHIPRKNLLLLYGDSKTGKTSLVNDLANKVVNGGFFLDEPVKAGHRFAFYSCDETKSVTKARMKRCGINLLKNKESCYYSNFVDLENLTEFEKEIKERQPDLIFIDCLFALANHLGLKPDDFEFTRYVRKLVNVCEKYNCTIILLHHANKDQLKTGLSSCYGSSALVSIPWGIWELKREDLKDETNPKRILKMTLRSEESTRHVLKFNNGNVWRTEGIFEWVCEVGDQHHTKGTHQEQVLEILEKYYPQPVNSQILEKELNLGESLHTALYRLDIKKMIVKMEDESDRRRWLYVLHKTKEVVQMNYKNTEQNYRTEGPLPLNQDENLEGVGTLLGNSVRYSDNKQNDVNDRIEGISSCSVNKLQINNTDKLTISNDNRHIEEYQQPVHNNHYNLEEEKKRTTQDFYSDKEIAQTTNSINNVVANTVDDDYLKEFGFQIEEKVRVSDKDSKFSEKTGIIDRYENGRYIIKFDELSAEKDCYASLHPWALEKI